MATLPTKFYIYPFAQGGDKSTIPDVEQSNGTVSYQEGYGPDYAGNIATDPDALSVPRDSDNQLYYDITNNILQYQIWGTPNFITSSQNNGSPYPYSKNALTLYDDGINGPRIFKSLINSNTNLPTVETAWRLVDDSGESLIINNATFLSGTADGQLVYYDSVNNWFAPGIANGSKAQNILGIADVTLNRVYIGGLIDFMSGLTAGTTYYLSTTVAGALTATAPTTYIVAVGTAISATQFIFNSVVIPATPRKVLAYFNTAGSSSFTVPPGVFQLDVQIWGGGGGGGGGPSGQGACGGGAGGYCRSIIDVNPGDVISYAIGAAGGAGSPGNYGSAGTTTTFGSLTANGGGAGGPSSVGVGGTASGGTVNINGGNGISYNGIASGQGGDSPRGGAGGNNAYSGGSSGGNSPGGGGSGGSSGYSGNVGADGALEISYEL